MPYIKRERRDIRAIFDELFGNYSHDIEIGEINYIITKILQQYCFAKKSKGKLNYSVYNEIVGVLECAKIEFYRRAVVPYEETKIRENGDLYQLESFNAKGEQKSERRWCSGPIKENDPTFETRKMIDKVVDYFNSPLGQKDLIEKFEEIEKDTRKLHEEVDYKDLQAPIR